MLKNAVNDLLYQLNNDLFEIKGLQVAPTSHAYDNPYSI